MIGALEPNQREVTVVGGGIAGLLMAERFSREPGWKVELYEASDRLGGLLGTAAGSFGPAERAAHSLIATEAVREHFSRIGLELDPVREDSRSRYIARDGKLRTFPLGPWEAIGVFARAYFSRSPRASESEDWTVRDWALQHLGESALERLVEPALSGIFGCRPEELSAQAALPAFCPPPGHSLLSFQLAKSVTRRARYAHLRSARDPERGLRVPRGGMQAWTERLAAILHRRPNVKIHFNAPATRLPDGKGNLILSVPVRPAARLLLDEFPASGAALARVRSAPMVSVTVFPEAARFPAGPPRGVGYLNPLSPDVPEVLGILFNSSAFPGRVLSEDRVSMTAMLGGTARPQAVTASDAEILSSITRELERKFDYRGGEPPALIHRWPEALPLYGPDLARSWKTLWEDYAKVPGRLAFANWTGKLSLRGMIETAEGLVF